MSSLPFSLLMPVYAGDRLAFVRRAFDSSVVEQTRRPAQVVIVRDGPVARDLVAWLDRVERESPVPVRLVELPVNRGLADALSFGLRACDHEVVARMDADDISLPHRFETELPLIESGADLVGSGLLEVDDEERVVGRRVPPTDPEQIARSARLHDPFNHPTVVYRRGAVEAAGGYQPLPLMEDYWLFARMIATGARVANVAEPLVKYRVGPASFARRGGLALLRSEVRLQRNLRGIGFIGRAAFARNLVVRGGYRLVPASLRRVAYRTVVATRGARLDAAHRSTGGDEEGSRAATTAAAWRP